MYTLSTKSIIHLAVFITGLLVLKYLQAGAVTCLLAGIIVHNMFEDDKKA